MEEFPTLNICKNAILQINFDCSCRLCKIDILNLDLPDAFDAVFNLRVILLILILFL